MCDCWHRVLLTSYVTDGTCCCRHHVLLPTSCLVIDIVRWHSVLSAPLVMTGNHPIVAGIIVVGGLAVAVNLLEIFNRG